MSEFFSALRTIKSTRRECSCGFCGRKFPVGSEVFAISGKWENEFYSVRYCQRCLDIGDLNADGLGENKYEDLSMMLDEEEVVKCPACGNHFHGSMPWEWNEPERLSLSVECEETPHGEECGHKWKQNVGADEIRAAVSKKEGT